jgi:hypothetical protein
MYAVVKEKVAEIEVQAVTRNCVFFFEEEEMLTGVNWPFAEFNSLVAFIFLKRGGVLE